MGEGFVFDLEIRRGAGAYICGEETALLSSLEGDRGQPRIRPPFPAVAGLYAKPTVVNNVETLSTLPHILTMGGAEYAKLGVNRSTGTRIFSLSGHVNRPGNYEVELGITFRDLIESPELGGGVRNGGRVKFLDIIEGVTMKQEVDQQTGSEDMVVIEHKEDLHPSIIITDDKNEPLASYPIPSGAHVVVEEGDKIVAGTLIVTIIAMALAAPIGLAAAIYLVELAPQRLSATLAFIVELIAAIPSVVIGLWAVGDLSLRIRDSIEWWIASSIGKVIPLFSEDPTSPASDSIFRAGFVLAIMILPFITAISRDVFATVPTMLKESAYGLGCTTWEVMRNVVIPYCRVGVIGGIMLALGRALGETMAVTFVIGNAHKISPSLLAPGTTISATIANEFTELLNSLFSIFDIFRICCQQIRLLIQSYWIKCIIAVMHKHLAAPS